MGEITFKTRQGQKDLTVVHYDSPLNVAQAKQALLEENTRWIGALQEEGSSIRVDGDQQLKPGSSYILTMRHQPGECYVLLLLFSLRVRKMQYHNLFCFLRRVLLPPLHTQLACICSLLMRRVNATSQHHMWLEGLALRPYYDLYLSQLTTEAKPASIAGREEEVISFWAKPYRQKLQALPAPNEFSTVWSAFQTPQGNLGDEVEFDKHGPLLNIYRPPSAKAWPNR